MGRGTVHWMEALRRFATSVVALRAELAMMARMRSLAPFIATLLVCLIFIPALAQSPEVFPGVDGVELAIDALTGRRVGVVTHQAAVSRDGRLTMLVLTSLPDVQLSALFAPEHGLGDDAPISLPANTPVYSLFGRVTQPTRQMLSGVDVLVIDLQDVGVRPFTYATTMALTMEAARSAGKPVIVLDRPNPMGGLLVDGPVLEPKLRSFIGMYPIPYVHGMTIGELAQLYNRAFGIGADLRVVPMRGWSRQMLWADTGLPWVNPSPGLLTGDSPFYYATTGAIDGTNLWNGVSTDSRFQVIVARWIDGARLAERLNRYKLPGVIFSAATVPLPFSKQVWSGVQLHVMDPSQYKPLTTTVYVLVEIRKMYGNRLVIRRPRRGLPLFDRVWGTREVRLGIMRGDDAATIVARWQPGLQQFLALRQRYLLYPDVPLSNRPAWTQAPGDGQDNLQITIPQYRDRGFRE